MGTDSARVSSSGDHRGASTEIDAILQGFAAAGADRGLYYLSTAITTGRRELELLERLGCKSRAELRTNHSSEWQTAVVAPNERDALLNADIFAETVSLGLLVVNPARINLRHWEQDHYDELWTRLIEDFPVVVVATPGWEFSRGARLEVQLAIQLEIQVLDVTGAALAPKTLIAMAESADAEIELRGWRFEGVELPPLDVRLAGASSRTPVRRFEIRSEPAEAFARQVFVWLARERNYQLKKFGVELDDEHTMQFGLAADGWWSRQLESYYHRARVLGIDQMNGRQALAKYVATACGLLESVVRVYGRLPAPGVPSGEIIDSTQ